MNVHYLYNLHFLEPNRVAQKRAIIGHQIIAQIIAHPYNSSKKSYYRASNNSSNNSPPL